jgi:aryl-alcohol dehydrogenase-like predicted oxidoreductase
MADMTYRRLGNSGLKVSVVGLGTNNFGTRMESADEATRVVDAALDVGINLFDTADAYGAGKSEEILGAALKKHRDDAIIATKFHQTIAPGPNEGGGSRHYVMRAVERSLKRLGTDYIDLYQLHRPDPNTPIEETLSALDDLVHQGKVRYIGSSNFAGWQIADADWTSRSDGLARFVSAQNNYSLLSREVEADVIPACERFGQGMLPFFPLASGMLTGKYRRNIAPPEGTRLASPMGARFMNEAAFDVVEALEKYAAERGVSLLTVAISGLAAQPTVSSVIAGATSPEQVRANVAAGTWTPTKDDLTELDNVAPSQSPAATMARMMAQMGGRPPGGAAAPARS